MALRADQRGWGPGFPNCQRDKLVTVALSNGQKLPVRGEISFLVKALAEETLRRGYWLTPGWNWGFACRAIRGSSTPSNHSWGLAVDLNAPTNPMGSTLKTDMPTWMVELWESYGFRWGGRYPTRPDAMHYEFVGTPADAQRLTKKILADGIGAAIGPVPPESKPNMEDDLMNIPTLVRSGATNHLYLVAPDLTQKLRVTNTKAKNGFKALITLKAQLAGAKDPESFAVEQVWPAGGELYAVLVDIPTVSEISKEFVKAAPVMAQAMAEKAASLTGADPTAIATEVVDEMARQMMTGRPGVQA